MGRWHVGAALLAVAVTSLAPGRAEAQKKQRDLITREEIMESAQKDGDLYQAVRSLRPHFLARPRGIRSMDVERGGSTGMQVGSGAAPMPILFVNGNRTGDVEGLKNILAADTYEVKYLDPARAQDQFGAEANGGAVLVTLVKGIKATPPPGPARRE